MRRLTFAFLFCALYFALADVPPAFGQQGTASDRSGTYKLLVVARNKSGSAIQEWKTEDISILDDGATAKVVGVQAGDQIPVRLGIVLLSAAPNFKAQQEAAIHLLATLRPNIDQAFVLTQATCDSRHLPGLQSGVCRLGDWPNQQVVWHLDLQSLSAFVRTLHWDMSLWEATQIAYRMLALDSDKPFRRILVEFRDPAMEGVVNWGPMLYKELEAGQINEISAYQRLNAVVYTFGVEDPFYSGSVGAPPTETMTRSNAAFLAYKDGESKIERIAAMTGGRSFLGVENFKSGVKEIKKDLENQFIVTFVPGPKNPNKPAHTLEVRTTRKDTRINAQKQYYPANP